MSKPNIKSFQKPDSQGWVLQACHGTANLALDSRAHSFFPCLVCAGSYAGDTTQTFLRSSYSQTGWKKQTCKYAVTMQKFQTGTNLPGDRFCLSQSNFNIYFI